MAHSTIEKEVSNKKIVWFKTVHTSKFPEDGGACVKVLDKQVAVFNFNNKQEWFASQNMCPHKKQMVLSRGLTGDKGGIPKVACPFHKRNFSLETGQCLDDASCDSIELYPVEVRDEYVFIGFEVV